jgi:hypothetical protein
VTAQKGKLFGRIPAVRRCIALPSRWQNVSLSCYAGKRRYDRKQSGYGGQTKPVFHKKVRFYLMSAGGWLVVKVKLGRPA